MPVFEIETLEYFESLATYTVEAETESDARELVISGDVPYDYHEHPGNNDRFSKILSCTRLDDVGERGSASGLFLALILLVVLLIIGSGVIVPVATMTP